MICTLLTTVTKNLPVESWEGQTEWTQVDPSNLSPAPSQTLRTHQLTSKPGIPSLPRGPLSPGDPRGPYDNRNITLLGQQLHSSRIMQTLLSPFGTSWLKEKMSKRKVNYLNFVVASVFCTTMAIWSKLQVVMAIALYTHKQNGIGTLHCIVILTSIPGCPLLPGVPSIPGTPSTPAAPCSPWHTYIHIPHGKTAVP